VDYEAIVYRPFKNEVLDAKVTLVHELGFNAVAGFTNLSIFISRQVCVCGFVCLYVHVFIIQISERIAFVILFILYDGWIIPACCIHD
jgi:DNA-directed RNA polymerase subunit E'/Rpb7